MSITVNGQSTVPPGFRFHPTEEELLNYYLRKKVAALKIDFDVIREVDLNKLEPWDIQEKCRIGTGPQNDWYFFSHKDKKYPTGTRTNRATKVGFWKATGRDKVIYSSFGRIGMRKTLVFYKGRAPHGQKSDWIMHEYRLDDVNGSAGAVAAADDGVDHVCAVTIGEAAGAGGSSGEDGWVVCRVFKKKHLLKEGGGGAGKGGSSKAAGSSDLGAARQTLLQSSSSDDALDQIIQYMGRTCKRESVSAVGAVGGEIPAGFVSGSRSSKPSRYLRPIETVPGINASSAVLDQLLKLPALESPTLPSTIADPHHYPPLPAGERYNYLHACVPGSGASDVDAGMANWAVMDRLVASQLNGDEISRLASFYSSSKLPNALDEYTRIEGSGGSSTPPAAATGEAAGAGSDDDLYWAFTRSASSSAPA